MNIRIQVMANQARQAIQQVRGDLTSLAAAGAAGAAGGSRMAGGVTAMGDALVKSGSKMQWAGRQLSYNFTLPIALAGAAATKFALQNEAAMVRVIKVYGDGSMSAQQITNETNALGRAFEMLSEKYGIARAQTIGIAADWAAAGSSGVALARQTELTMQTMVLGEMDATTATQSLIAIQAQYGQSSTELADTVARLNAIENQTGTTMDDLIQSMARSSGVARAAGVDVSHLAAMTAALTPAAGSASQAGNALKTIISRLLSPTKDARDILGAMGIGIADIGWKSVDAGTRIAMISKKFESLSDAQKGVVSATLASRYQINKFEVLMNAVATSGSYYWKALDAVGNGLDANAARTKYFRIQQMELNKVLDSSPNKFARMKVMLQNTLADAIQPLLPVMLSLAGTVASLAKRFDSLSPNVQKLIVEFLLFLAVLGPIITKIGALKTLGGFLFKMFGSLLGVILPVIGALWGVVAGIAAIGWAAFIFAMDTASTAVLAFAGGLGVMIVAVFGALGAMSTFAVTFVRAIGLNIILKAWAFLWTQIMFYTGFGLAATKALIIRGFSAIPGLMSAAFARVGAAITGAWAAVGAVLAPVWSAAWAAVIRVQEVAMTVLATIGAAFQRGLIASFVLLGEILPQVMTQIGVAMAEAWTRVMYVIDGIMTAAGRVWTALLAAIGTVMEFVWAGVQAALAAVTAAGSAVMTALMTGFGIGWINIFKSIGTGMVAVWKLSWGALTGVASVGRAALTGLVQKMGPMLLKALTNPWVLAAVAVGLALYAMRDKLGNIWNNIVKFFYSAVDNVVKAFYGLPKGVQGAIMAVVTIVKNAAMAVYHWFSYLNPFAHHSPSLVENVTNGMAAVNKQFGTLYNIKGPIDAAYASIKRFKNAALDLAKGYDSIKTANEVADLSKAGASPALISSYIALAGQLSVLKDRQNALNDAVNNQQKVVDAWQNKLNAANDALDAQKNKLQQLQDVASKYKDAISSMQDDLSRLASAPLKGMGAMDDAIFANQQSQKKLQLQMDLMAQKGGGDYQKIADKLASINGQMETLSSTKMDLRAAGAGSEILGKYDAQIAALADQKKAVSGQAVEVTAMQDALAKLQAQADILDLQKSLQFDALTRAIDQAANGMQELPFDQVMKGIATDKAGIAALTTQYDAATAAVNKQQGAVDAAQATVNSVQAGYDAQKKTLDSIKSSYDAVTQAIQDMSQAMQDANAAAAGLKQAKTPALSPAMQNFADGAGGNFPDVGGSAAGIGREGGAGDQSKAIDDWIKKSQSQMSDAFGGFDMFAPFKDMWKKFVGWWDATAWPFIKGIGTMFGSIFSGVDFSGVTSKFTDLFTGVDWSGMLTKTWATISNVLSTVWDFASMLWDLIGPDVQDILNQLVGFFKSMFGRVGSVWKDLADRVGPFMEALGNLWDLAKPFLAFFVGRFVVGIVFAFKLIKNIINPVLTFIGDMFHAIWEIVRGVLDMFIGIFTGDWKRVWDGFISILKGAWDVFLSIFKGLGGIIWGIVKSIFETLVGIGSYLITGISMGIGQAWDAFINWLGGLWNGFIDFIKGILGIHSPSTVMAQIGGWLIQGFLDGIKAVWNVVMAFFGTELKILGAIFTWLWSNVIKPIATAIGTIFSWLWNSVLKPVFGFIGDAFKVLMTAMSWAWDNILHPVINLIGTVITWLWTNVLKGIFWLIQTEWKGLMIIMEWAWNNILHPVFNLIGTVATWLWNNILKPIFGLIGSAWSLLIKGLAWYWDNVLHPVWNAISTVLGWLWNTIMKPIFGLIGSVWSALMKGIAWAWDNIVKPAWNAISTAIGWLWNNIMKPIFDAIGKGWRTLMDGIAWVWTNVLKPVFDTLKTWLGNMGGWWSTAVTAVGKAWDGIKEKAKTPIQWVIDIVWNNGLRKLWNVLNGLWGGHDIDPFTVNFAKGGVTPYGGKDSGMLPGYTPGRDVHKFYSPTGGILNLSGGEAVMRPEFTKALGGVGGVDYFNNLARNGGAAAVRDALTGVPEQSFARGGQIDIPTWLKLAGSAVVPGFSMIEPLVNSINSSAGGAGDWFDRMYHIPPDQAGKIFSKVKDAVTPDLTSWFSSNTTGGTGNDGQGSDEIKKFIYSVDPLPYIWGGVGPNGYDCSGLAGEIFARMTGRRSYSRYFTTGSIGNGSQYGFKPGLGGMLNLGFNDHHVVGEYGGLGFEAQSTATGILTGAHATNPSTMPKQMHLANGGMLSKQALAALAKEGIGIGGDPSNAAFAKDLFKKKGSLFDTGGLLQHGAVGANMSGAVERVLSPRQTVAFEKLVDLLGHVDFMKLESRTNGSVTAAQPVTYNYNGDTVTINITGNLEFPGIKDAKDAKTFLQNLADMSGGGKR